jgi:uroporphyrinogen decarboxylase
MDHLERFLYACRNGVPDRPPVWLLRQAGRYLPEYRKLRTRHSFRDILGSPELAAKVSLQPLKRFGMDAAIVFSDILVAAQASGRKVTFSEKGVRIEPAGLLRSEARKLRWKPSLKPFGKVAGAIENIRREVGPRFPIIGFAGAPFTLACYMIEGGGKGRDFARTRGLMAERSMLLDDLLGRMAEIVALGLDVQMQASADAVMLFDSLAEILGPAEHKRFALPYLNSIFYSARARNVPTIYYARGLTTPVEKLRGCGVDVFAVDWRRPLSEAGRLSGGALAVQGNLDPALLFGSEKAIRAKVKSMIGETGGKGHIVNLGAGIFPNTPVGGVAAMVDEVKKIRLADL